MTAKERRKVEQEIQHELVKLLTEGDSEADFFVRLLIANQFIANELARFSDVFDVEE